MKHSPLWRWQCRRGNWMEWMEMRRIGNYGDERYVLCSFDFICVDTSAFLSAAHVRHTCLWNFSTRTEAPAIDERPNIADIDAVRRFSFLA